MCSPTVGRVVNGIATMGLSEAVRPMLGGGNRDLLDNSGTLGIGPAFFYSQSKKNDSQPKQEQSFNFPKIGAPVPFSQPQQLDTPDNIPGANFSAAPSKPRQIT